MITKIQIDNFEGINAPVELDFISKSRNRSNNPSVAEIEKGIYANKVIGIVGGNASGKTSILNAINLVRKLITSPIYKYDIESKMAELEKIKSNSKEELKRLYNIIDEIQQYNTSIDISKIQNAGRIKEPTMIMIELFIEDEKPNMTGFYTYEISIDGINKNIKNEKLSYRKKYKSKNNVITEVSDAKEGQVYYISRYYKNIKSSISENNPDFEEDYMHISSFVEHYFEDSAIIVNDGRSKEKTLSYSEWYEKDSGIIRRLAKIIDNKIKDVVVDKNHKEKQIKFILQDGSKIGRSELSTGTDRFLYNMMHIDNVISECGFILIDEIEQNLSNAVVKLIIELFEKKANKSQIIFTTLRPEIFDMADENERKLFKQDEIYILDNEQGETKLDKLSDLKIDNKNIKKDASVANLYKNNKIQVHPNELEVNEYIEEYNKRLSKASR